MEGKYNKGYESDWTDTKNVSISYLFVSGTSGLKIFRENCKNKQIPQKYLNSENADFFPGKFQK